MKLLSFTGSFTKCDANKCAIVIKKKNKRKRLETDEKSQSTNTLDKKKTIRNAKLAKYV